MLSELTNHRTGDLLNDGITIKEQKGVYTIAFPGTKIGEVVLKFQEGPVDPDGENPVNGLSMEVLLVVVKDRLEGFQAGALACEDNRHALVRLQQCLLALGRRTVDRIARGVEGTDAP